MRNVWIDHCYGCSDGGNASVVFSVSVYLLKKQLFDYIIYFQNSLRADDEIPENQPGSFVSYADDQYM